MLPGQYYGAKHIHIGAVHDGYAYLQTEILFKGDPNLDPESDSKYAIHLEEATVNDKTVPFGRFHMILRPFGGGGMSTARRSKSSNGVSSSTVCPSARGFGSR